MISGLVYDVFLQADWIAWSPIVLERAVNKGVMMAARK